MWLAIHIIIDIDCALCLFHNNVHSTGAFKLMYFQRKDVESYSRMTITTTLPYQLHVCILGRL